MSSSFATPWTVAHQAPLSMGILQARTLEWVAISLSNAWKWKVKVTLLSRVRLLATPWIAAYLCQQIWKSQQWPQDWKRSVFIPIPKKGNAKECSNYRTIAFISHTSKVMLKILQARLQKYMNYELPDVKAGSIKGRGTRDQIASTSAGSLKKQESFRRISTSALLTMPKPLTVWITINCGKS